MPRFIGSSSLLELTILGGTVSQAGGYTYHTFTSSGNFVISISQGIKNLKSMFFIPSAVSTSITVEVLGVAGGAGGGMYGGGGGAGELREWSALELAVGTYPIVIGSGGAAGVRAAIGSNGSPTTFNGTSLNGGGAGGYWNSGPTQASALDGGSGGGAGYSHGADIGESVKTGGGVGYNGGQTASTSTYCGGGGGATAVGANGTSTNPGYGGTGVNWKSLGTYYGDGGGGSDHFASVHTLPTGGSGTGGTGGEYGTRHGTNAVVNSGSGGGGGSLFSTYLSGNGGSGITIIRYLLAA